MICQDDTYLDYPEDRKDWEFTSITGEVILYGDVRIFCKDTVIPTYSPTSIPTTVTNIT